MTSKRRRPIQREEVKPVISQQMILIIGAIALLLVGGLLVLGNYSQSQTVNVDLNTEEFPSMGDPNAPVTMIEYSDYGCSHCRNFKLEKFPQLQAEYIETGNLYYVNHPYYLGNPQIGFAEEASLCAADQGKYFEFSKAVFENTAAMSSEAGLMSIARDIEGLNMDSFSSCLSARTHRNTVESGRQAAANEGISSTPTFFINGQMVEGNQPMELFREIIDRELARVPAQ